MNQQTILVLFDLLFITGNHFFQFTFPLQHRLAIPPDLLEGCFERVNLLPGSLVIILQGQRFGMTLFGLHRKRLQASLSLLFLGCHTGQLADNIVNPGPFFLELRRYFLFLLNQPGQLLARTFKPTVT